MSARCILILVITSMFFSPIYACDCVQNTLDHSIKYTRLIITGIFIQGEQIWELSQQKKDAPILYYTGTFVVTQVLKGEKSRRVTLCEFRQILPTALHCIKAMQIIYFLPVLILRVSKQQFVLIQDYSMKKRQRSISSKQSKH